jgi:hypothetical protein
MPEEKKSFTILDLLAEVGIDNLNYQVLSECLCGTQRAIYNKKTKRHTGGSQLTFGTPEDLGAVAFDFTRDAVVIWMDRPKMLAAWQKLQAALGEPTETTHQSPPPKKRAKARKKTA